MSKSSGGSAQLTLWPEVSPARTSRLLARARGCEGRISDYFLPDQVNIETRRESAAGPPDQESNSASGKRRAWHTPTANSYMDGGSNSRRAAKRDGRYITGSLNPAWVSQLMGFPDGWLPATDALLSALSATPSARRSRK